MSLNRRDASSSSRALPCPTERGDSHQLHLSECHEAWAVHSGLEWRQLWRWNAIRSYVVNVNSREETLAGDQSKARHTLTQDSRVRQLGLGSLSTSKVAWLSADEAVCNGPESANWISVTGTGSGPTNPFQVGACGEHASFEGFHVPGRQWNLAFIQRQRNGRRRGNREISAIF